METEKNVAIEAMTNAQLIDGAATVSELFLRECLSTVTRLLYEKRT